MDRQPVMGNAHRTSPTRKAPALNPAMMPSLTSTGTCEHHAARSAMTLPHVQDRANRLKRHGVGPRPDSERNFDSKHREIIPVNSTSLLLSLLCLSSASRDTNAFPYTCVTKLVSAFASLLDHSKRLHAVRLGASFRDTSASRK